MKLQESFCKMLRGITNDDPVTLLTVWLRLQQSATQHHFLQFLTSWRDSRSGNLLLVEILEYGMRL